MRGGNIFLNLKNNTFCLVKTLNKKTIFSENNQPNQNKRLSKYYALIYEDMLYVLDKGTVYSVVGFNKTTYNIEDLLSYKNLNVIKSNMLVKEESFIYYVYKNKLYFFKQYNAFAVPTLKRINYFYKNKLVPNTPTNFNLPTTYLTKHSAPLFKLSNTPQFDYKPTGGSGWVDYSRTYFASTDNSLKKSFNSLLNTDKGRTLFSNFFKKNIPYVHNVLNPQQTNHFYDPGLSIVNKLTTKLDVSQTAFYSYVDVLKTLKREESAFTISYKLEQNFINFLNNLELKNSENLNIHHTTQNSFGLKFKRLFSRKHSMKLKYNKSPINLTYKS